MTLGILHQCRLKIFDIRRQDETTAITGYRNDIDKEAADIYRDRIIVECPRKVKQFVANHAPQIMFCSDNQSAYLMMEEPAPYWIYRWRPQFERCR